METHLEHFGWNGLITADVECAKKFYRALLGWSTEAFSGGIDYTLFKKKSRIIGGFLGNPKREISPQWIAYVNVEDVDATAARATELGAEVMAEPFDIPEVGRIAVIFDPQGTAFGLLKPLNARRDISHTSETSMRAEIY